MRLTKHTLEQWLPLLPERARHFHKWLMDLECADITVYMQYETGKKVKQEGDKQITEYYITIFVKREDKDVWYKVVYELTPDAYQEITGEKVVEDIVVEIENANSVVLAIAYALLTDFPNTAEAIEYEVYKWDDYMTPVDAQFVIKKDIIEIWIKRNDIREYDYEMKWELPKTKMVVGTLGDIVKQGRGKVVKGDRAELIKVLA